MSNEINIEYSVLINKSQFKNWMLPSGFYKNIKVEDHPYFFIICNSGIDSQTKSKLTIIPTEHANVHQLRIITKLMNPNILNMIMKKLKDQDFQVLTTSGGCPLRNDCEFNIYFSTSYCGDFKDLIDDFKSIDDVKDVVIIVHSQQGCDEEE